MIKRLLLCTLAGCLLGLPACSSSSSSSSSPVVVMDTSMGTIKIELYPDKAPITVKNFLQYVDDKYYDDTTFHRVIPDFMVQGGGFPPGDIARNREKPGVRPAIKNESYNGLFNQRGTVAMARTPAPDSATAQFFINVKDNDFLDKAKAQDGVGYCVFGKVIEGMDVVDKIKTVPTQNLSEQLKDIPVQDVIIKSIRRAD
jgi:cyclophilin family peptidyl-prolyl cis-trans isomerase